MDLPLGTLKHPSGHVVSWDIDREDRCLLVRLRNATSVTKRLNLDLVNLEATVCFDVGGLNREFFDHDFYMKRLTSEWFQPEIQIAASSAIDWRVPFDRLDAHPVENESKTGFNNQNLTFDECLAVSDPVITSFWAFRYIENMD